MIRQEKASVKAKTPSGNLAQQLVARLSQRIRSGALAAGSKLPTEGQLMQQHGVSRTVVREALSRLQAAGQVHTRHGVGSFVAEAAPAGQAFSVGPQQLATLADVVALLELRIGVETEAAGLAAQRRSAAQLARMRQAVAEFERSIEAGESAVQADYELHAEIARATGNAHFDALINTLGPKIIPRARLRAEQAGSAQNLAYLRQVNAEHRSIVQAIAARDAQAARAAMRVHLANSRERRRAAAVAASRGSAVVR